MAKGRRWEVKLPDGTSTGGRTTKDYTHAVAVQHGPPDPESEWQRVNRPEGSWGVWSTHAGHERAMKQANTVSGYGHKAVTVLPVDYPEENQFGQFNDRRGQ